MSVRTEIREEPGSLDGPAPSRTAVDKQGRVWSHDGTKATEGEVLELLYSLVRCEKPVTVVETGTFAGHGAVAISNALVSNDHGHLTTVEYDDDLYDLLSGADLPRTTFIHADSLDFCESYEGFIDFAFVDCGDYTHRAEVIAVLMPKVRGLLITHDTVFYPKFLPLLEEMGVRKPDLVIPTLHGVAIWRNGNQTEQG